MTDNKIIEQEETLLLRRKLDLLLRTGKLLVESAADTNRVVRNMKRVAAYLGLPEEKLHIDVSYTMLMVNVSDEAHSFSKFQKCEKHGINMTAISAISKLSWRAIEQDYSLDEIWDSFIEQIALYEERAEQTDALSIEDRLAIQDQILKLEKKIDKTENAMWKEQQPKKKFELHTRLREYQKKLEDLKHGKS